MNLIGIDGTIRRIPGWPNEPLNSSLNRHWTTGFNASCDGGKDLRRYSDETVAPTATEAPSCGKCHVVVSDPWYTYMKPKVHPVELDSLEKTNSSVFPTSRLACCINLKPWMNEMIVRLHYDANLHLVEDDDHYGHGDSSVGGSNPYKGYNY